MGDGIEGRFAELLADARITDGRGFKLGRHETTPPGHFEGGKDEGERLLEEAREWLGNEQVKLYAQDRWSVLVILQAMDAAGKDGAIRHVMAGVDPQGVHVTSFKAPSAEELDHDFLWRCARALPERGRIGIFNRSYYEEVLVVRVHRELLARQKLPSSLVTKDIWKERCEDIVAYERYLARNGTRIVKVFLNVSREEQKARFLERIDDPEKNWKFSAADIKERGHWDQYMKAYEDMIRRTATPWAPWYVIPADKKWYARLGISAAIVEAIEQLDLAYPELDAAGKAQLTAAREQLTAEEE